MLSAAVRAGYYRKKAAVFSIPTESKKTETWDLSQEGFESGLLEMMVGRQSLGQLMPIHHDE